MNTFVTHPSIRIKGTENNYEPILCMDSNCVNKNPHMHCPFCLKTEAYLDPVILKAHYRVKHVDKGIEFAGLKVLRCCDHCDIVGSIKGAKEFRGAHWHCYRCRNGFNRRDEAIKHFRTHFRNPQTTFQIQVNEEVNQMFNLSNEADDNGEVLTDFATPIAGDCDSAENDGSSGGGGPTYGMSGGVTLTNGGKHEVHVAVAANETVGTTDETHAIMIIEAADLDGSQPLPDSPTASPVLQGVLVGGWLQKQEELEKRINELTEENMQLALAKDEMEQQMHQLSVQVSTQAQQMSSFEKREQELLDQLSIPLNASMQQLLGKMAADHEDLLHQQLAYLRRAYLQPAATTAFVLATAPPVVSPGGDAATVPRVGIKEAVQKVMPVDIEGYMDAAAAAAAAGKLADSQDGNTQPADDDDDDDTLADGFSSDGYIDEGTTKKRSRETESEQLDRVKLKKGS